jgi:hypothetical protein
MLEVCCTEGSTLNEWRFNSCHLGNNISAIPEQLISTASLIKEFSGESLPKIDSTFCTNKFIYD